jgi:hypothetical protein
MTQVCLSGPVHAAPSEWACAEAARTAEQTQQVPQQFLEAMGRVESGQYVPGHTALVAWPWTVNAEGRGYFYNTKQEAIQAVRDMQQRGVESIDVGCLQINLRQHPDAFSSLEHAFDPVENTVWAAHFLKTLYARTGSWPHAAAAYHSFTPDIGAVYQQKVLEAWASPEGVKSGVNSSGRQMKNQPVIVADRGTPPARHKRVTTYMAWGKLYPSATSPCAILRGDRKNARIIQGQSRQNGGIEKRAA